MNTIRALPEHLINKIAAGEVIERPASILKELVENALDARASSIQIQVKNGGCSFIRISDDGTGMSGKDLELAFIRHTTSKIISEDDLYQIRSFGFRGEALASIAAVARVRCVSRRKEDSQATELVIEGGKVLSVKAVPASVGTTVEVKDLFFNTPARRKFLKSEGTEYGHVYEMVVRFALAHEKVRFHFSNGEKMILETLPQESIKSRSGKLLSREDRDDWIEINTEHSGVKLWGVLGSPKSPRNNRSEQYFYVNGRWIKSAALSYALQAGYHGRLMHGQYPAAVLMLEINPSEIDVNIHPTKQEIRFSKESVIKSMIQQSVSQVLEKNSKTSLQERASSFSSSPVSYASEERTASSSFSSQGAGKNTSDLELNESLVSETMTPGFGKVYAQALLQTPETIRTAEFEIVRVLGQIHQTFVVAETDKGMLLVDQHAANERVRYEALVQIFENQKQSQSQRLLMDEILDFKPLHVELLTKEIPFFQRLGFEIESFGEKSFIVRSLPGILASENPRQLLLDYLEKREEGKMSSKVEDAHFEIAAMIACKRQSVKAHESLPAASLHHMLKQLFECKNPGNCPHGRPAYMHYSYYDFEKLFKRKV